MKLLNPVDVQTVLMNNHSVKKWLKFISNIYEPPLNKNILLLYPCSKVKPYHSSRSYKILFKTLKKLREARDKIHVMTVSEPYGLVPEEFYGRNCEWHDWENSWYDCPGLFEWWCRKHKQPYSVKVVDKCIEYLASYVAGFFSRVKKKGFYSRIIAFVRTYSSSLRMRHDHTHRRIVERAAELASVEVEVLPSREFVRYVVRRYGRLAWDFYGVAHPAAQRHLLKHLRRILNGDKK